MLNYLVPICFVSFHFMTWINTLLSRFHSFLETNFQDMLQPKTNKKPDSPKLTWHTILHQMALTIEGFQREILLFCFFVETFTILIRIYRIFYLLEILAMAGKWTPWQAPRKTLDIRIALKALVWSEKR